MNVKSKKLFRKFLNKIKLDEEELHDFELVAEHLSRFSVTIVPFE